MTHEEKERQAERPNYFDEVMAVIDSELMLRLRKRFQKRGNTVMVNVMNAQIDIRTREEKAEHEAEKKRHEEAKKAKKNK